MAEPCKLKGELQSLLRGQLIIKVEDLQKQRPSTWHWMSRGKKASSQCSQLWSTGTHSGEQERLEESRMACWFSKVPSRTWKWWSEPTAYLLCLCIELWQENLCFLSVVDQASSCSTHSSVYLTKPLTKEPLWIILYVNIWIEQAWLTTEVIFRLNFDFNHSCSASALNPQLPYRALF